MKYVFSMLISWSVIVHFYLFVKIGIFYFLWAEIAQYLFSVDIDG